MDKPKRAGPGRPAKNPVKPVPLLNGVVKKPSKPDYTIELVYEIPVSFKKVFGMIYSCNKKDVTFIFKEDHILIACPDHHNKLSIQTTIMATNCISYYCREPCTVLIVADDIKKLCNIIKKNFGSIKLYMTDKTNNSYLHVNLDEQILDSSDQNKIPVSLTTIKDNILLLQDNKYEVSFKLDTNHFKKRLTTYVDKKMDICKIVYDPGAKSKIKFRYSTSDNLEGDKTKYRNEGKIDVISTSNTPVECMYKLEYIINVFKTIISQEFYVLMSQEHGVCLNFYLDPVDQNRLTQPYIYKDKVSKDSTKKDSIIVRVYCGKNM